MLKLKTQVVHAIVTNPIDLEVNDDDNFQNY